ncbi:hypothetical protein [Pseudomonas tohonis]|uniref:hypothetical protein n=1 Tax=Pseudomonas tohonis TaxID=2725477 RepID=UPI001F45C63E|nr:hypothetical protein [Pseudomonas tohonis]
MSINLDVVIGTPEYEVDMKSGLDTLHGVSDATRCIAETLLTQKVPQRQTSKSSVRTILKRTFSGSYGQIYSLDISDEELRKEYKKIGNTTFAELMTYFMNESLYIETAELTEKAQRIILKLGDVAGALTKQLRVSAMVDIHEVAIKFGHPVVIRHRKSGKIQIPIASFSSKTVQALQATESEEQTEILASITRLNINTGNGRLLIKGADETVAFGFGIEYSAVQLAAKKKFSENLNFNNGIEGERWKYLRIIVRPIKLRDGRIIKYIVKGYHND